MLEFENTSIRKKLIVIQLTTAFLSVLFCCVFFFYNDINVFKETSVNTKYSIAEIIGLNATPALEFLDKEAARQMLLKLESNPSILNAVILDKDGKEFARYNKPGEEKFLFPSAEVEKKTQRGLDQKFIVSYRMSQDGFVGTVKLRSELTGFREMVLNYLNVAAIILLTSLIVAFLISNVLQRPITTRLLALVNKTKQVADTDDYSIRVPAHGNDEVATLSRAFNDMLGQIEKIQGVLKRSNIELEKRVKVRTAELETANVGLKESEEQIQTIFRTAPNALVVINETGGIMGWNKRAEEIFGWTAEEVMGEPMHDIIMPARFRQMHLNGIAQFLTTGEGAVFNKSLELAAIRRDQSEFPIEIRISYTKPKDKYFFIALISDITERKKAETQLKQQSEELMRANKELEQFVYIASHDLQEPLRTLSNYAGLLQESYSEKLDDTANKYLASLMKAASRMRTLIKDLLELSRIGKNVKISRVDTNEILKEVISQLDAAIDESNTKITSSELPILRANEVELKQLFQNLISNAIKFRKKERVSEIHITAEEKPTEYLFAFRDNGIGIEEQYKDRIFIVFQRLHGKGEYPGTGIGLATCQKIVALHKGKIWVESELGRGSTFYFTLSKKL